MHMLLRILGLAIRGIADAPFRRKRAAPVGQSEIHHLPRLGNAVGKNPHNHIRHARLPRRDIQLAIHRCDHTGIIHIAGSNLQGKSARRCGTTQDNCQLMRQRTLRHTGGRIRPLHHILVIGGDGYLNPRLGYPNMERIRRSNTQSQQQRFFFLPDRLLSDANGRLHRGRSHRKRNLTRSRTGNRGSRRRNNNSGGEIVIITIRRAANFKIQRRGTLQRRGKIPCDNRRVALLDGDRSRISQTQYRRCDTNALFIKNAFLSIHNAPQIRRGKTAPAASARAFQPGQCELKCQPGVPARAQRLLRVVTRIAPLHKHPGQNPIAGVKFIRRRPAAGLVALALKAPIADAAIQMDALQHQADAQIRTALRQFFIAIATFEPVGQRVVIVRACMNNAALQIQSEARATMSAAEVMVVKDRATRDRLGIDEAAIDQSEIAVDALLPFNAGPEDQARLKEHSGAAIAPNRKHRVYLALNVFAEDPAQLGIHPKAIVEQRDAALCQSVLDGVEEESSGHGAQGLLATGGIVAARRGGNATALESIDLGVEGGIGATGKTAPDAVEFGGGAPQKPVIGLRGRRMTGEGQEQQSEGE